MKPLALSQKLAGAVAASATLVACTSGWGAYDSPDYGYGRGASTSSSGYFVVDGGARGNKDTYLDAGIRAECIDWSGFGGRGCFDCEPQTNDELLIACTDARYEEFDDETRIAGYSAATPRPALPPRGPDLPPFVGDHPSEPGEPLPPAPPCPISTKPNPVMVLGATGLPFETIARAMGSAATIFYAERGSCEGVASMLIGEPKLSGEIVYFDADGTKNRCTLSGEHPADVTTSALFATTCAGESGLSEQLTLPANVEDYVGPANTVMFTVPATARERAISAAAAYKVFGFGAGSGVAPWTNEELVFRRRASSGNQQTVALSLGLPPDALRGRDANGSSNMLAAIRTSPNPQATIGFSSSEIVDPNRDVLKALAYKHYVQPVAFYPDSDPASFDRRNVRDGHYYMWLPLHVLARTSAGEPIAVANPHLDPTGAKKSARDDTVRRLVYVMTSRQEPPVRSVDLFGALKRTGNVPQCAMHVQRAREAAPLEPYTPTSPCDCAFEAAAPGATPPECKPCASSFDCAGDRPVCSFGYCEGAR
ncbi:MAG: hypothetical protein KIT84_22770 [Labilithrix sp.]|nr:hypothetical protein [Labilithrix sp.]MCW5813869.1 hypothetical protein [Labilithrix sp.]